jgi:hypothetical protein
MSRSQKAVNTPEYVLRAFLKIFLTNERVLGREVVKLYVGPERKKVTVHKKLLCDRCHYFKAAFTTGFKEAQDNTMEMPEDDPVVVQLMVDFIYRGQSLRREVDSVEKLIQLKKAYYLAEKICYTKFMDELIDEIDSLLVRVDAHFQTSEYGGIEIFANTHSSSKLRLLCVSSLACRWHDESILDLSAEYSDLMETCPEGPELLKAVFNFLADYEMKLDKIEFDREDIYEELGPCVFHAHDPKEYCSKKKNTKTVRDIGLGNSKIYEYLAGVKSWGRGFGRYCRYHRA